MKDPTDGAEKSQEKIFKVALPVSLEAVFQTSLGFIDRLLLVLSVRPLFCGLVLATVSHLSPCCFIPAYGLHRFERLLKSLTGSATSLSLDLQVDLDTVSAGCPFFVQLSRASSFQQKMVD